MKAIGTIHPATLNMLHLLGVNLPDHKKVPVALAHFYGIGQRLGAKICHQLSIHPACKLQELTDAQLNKLGEVLNGMKLEGDLRREVKNRILHHRQIGTVTGRKFELGLPVRGQRLRTNAKTAHRLNRRWLAKDFSTFTMPQSKLPISSHSPANYIRATCLSLLSWIKKI